MRKYVYCFLSSILVFLCSATCQAQDTALLMVHFGTTYDETRAKTIDALLKLRSEGIKKVKIQPTYIIDGIEMDRLRQDVQQVRPFFDSIWVSTPLLYTVEDAEKVCKVLVTSASKA